MRQTTILSLNRISIARPHELAGIIVIVVDLQLDRVSMIIPRKIHYPPPRPACKVRARDRRATCGRWRVSVCERVHATAGRKRDGAHVAKVPGQHRVGGLVGRTGRTIRCAAAGGAARARLTVTAVFLLLLNPTKIS